MRILFDARPARACPTGIGRYARTLAVLLRAGLPGHDVAVLPDDVPFAPPDAAGEELALPALLARERVDLLHGPLWRLPAVLPTPAVVTVHDAIPAARPDLATPEARALWESAPGAAARAAAVVAPSAHAAAEVARHLEVPPDRVRVLPECPAQVFEEPRPAGDALLARRGLARPFLLVVGALEHRKAPDVALAALAALDDRRATLAFAGPPGRVDVAAEARRRGVAARVRILGHVPDPELAALYAAAAALVHPSRAEGFGLPLVEAFAAGAPVVAARAGAVPEVVGDAAVLVPPDDPQALGAALDRVLADADLGRALRARGRARLAGRYTPAAVRRGLRGLYALAAGRSPGLAEAAA